MYSIVPAIVRLDFSATKKYIILLVGIKFSVRDLICDRKAVMSVKLVLMTSALPRASVRLSILAPNGP